MLLLDAMAQRYSVLPSNMLRNADSFDYLVFDVANTYTAYKQSQKEGTVPKGMYSQQDIEERFSKSTGKNINEHLKSK